MTEPMYCSTLKSPQILELSGFGRKEVLEKIGVPVKVELPGVGENVQEHIFLGLSWGMYCVSYKIFSN
jgi:choline dehydrogenase-like flavoprotein